MTYGIDGKVELVAELDRLSGNNPLAALAPRGTGLAKYLDKGLTREAEMGDIDGPLWRLTVDLIERLGIWWSPRAASVMPSMTPWCIRDRSARYDQGPEMWGAPRADGYLRDDNSIIKKLPLPVSVDGPGDSPFRDRKPWRGFTACHIWRELEDGSIGGTDPWIYSFMANLVWLPTPLAPLTDHNPRVKDLLQRTSRLLHYRPALDPVEPWASRVWSRLLSEAAVGSGGPSLRLERLATFRADTAFISRRTTYLDQFVAGVDEVLVTGALRKKLVCTRYTVGMPLLERDALASFRDALSEYADAVRKAAAMQPRVDIMWTPPDGAVTVAYGTGAAEVECPVTLSTDPITLFH